MPIGLFLCFWPIVIAWVIASMKGPQAQAVPQDRQDRH